MINSSSQIAALNAVLAEATKECPCPKHKTYQRHSPCLDIEVDEGHGKLLCDGSGRVAHFPDFRQECQGCNGRGGYDLYPGYADSKYHKCNMCGGNGWQVRAGGLEDALAGLNGHEFSKWADWWIDWIEETAPPSRPAAAKPMPLAPKILLKGLELVCEVAGLEVSDA